MRINFRFLVSASFTLLVAGAAFAQEVTPDRVSVPFSDPSRPGTLKAHVLSGGITIKGYESKEVVIEARSRGDRGERRSRSEENTAGMRRLQNPFTGLTAEEENNVISVGVSAMSRAVDLTIQVPLRTSLKLSSVNDGNIKVERVQGEIEVNNTNGEIVLSGISGSVVAHALNGNIYIRKKS